MSKSVTKDADRQLLRVVLLYSRGRLLVLRGSVLLFAAEPPIESVAPAIETITIVPKMYLRDLKHVRHYAHVILAR